MFRSRVVSYITDIEGNLDFFTRYVQKSRVVRFTADGGLAFREEGTMFVFGGDLFDKGPGDLALSRLLVNFKTAFPTRVVLLMGNRDINKLRFASELSPAQLAKPPSEIPPPFWDKKAPSLVDYLSSESREDGLVSRLQYLLHHTLGCKETFDARRTELQRTLGTMPTDDEVAESFMKGIRKGGYNYSYLRAAQIAAVVNDTLYVHGAVTPAGLKFVPSLSLQYTEKNGDTGKVEGEVLPGDSLEEWVNRLNAFAQEALDEYDKHPEYDEKGWRGGDALMAYQSHPATAGRNVVVESWYSRGEVEKLAPEVEAFLTKNGVVRLVTGHKPIGDCPMVVRCGAIEMVAGDTSYSDPTATDGRGQVGYEILVDDDGVEINGVDKDGTEVSFRPGKDPLIGTKVGEGWWVKAVANGMYTLMKQEGWDYIYHRVPCDSLTANPSQL